MRLILITGVSSGLGRACFDILVQNEVYLWCFSRKFLDYQKQIARNNQKINLIIQDLNDLSSLEANLNLLENKNLQNLKELIFISNAGIVEPVAKAGNYLSQNVVLSSNVNYLAPVIMSNSVLKLSQQYGCSLKLVNVTSGAASRPVEGWSMYCSVKAAMKMYYDCLKAENISNKRFSVYNFNPGVMDTQMQEKLRMTSEDDFPDLERYIRLKEDNQLANPEKVAEKLLKDCGIML